MIRLITGPLSMFGRKVEIALREKKLDFKREFVPFSLTSFYDPIHPDVSRINPKNQVPVLADDDLNIFDSTLIFNYLEDAYPSPALWPNAPKDRAKARLTELKADEVFFSKVQMFMPHNMSGFDVEMRVQGAATIQDIYSEWDQQLSETQAYLHGDFGYADIAAFLAQFFASFLGHAPKNDNAALQDWSARMMQRPSVALAVSDMTQYLSGNT